MNLNYGPSRTRHVYAGDGRREFMAKEIYTSPLEFNLKFDFLGEGQEGEEEEPHHHPNRAD